MKKTIAALLICSAACCPVLRAAETKDNASEAERSIHLKMDDAQVHFGSRIYELQHVTSESILPFVNSAILRYNRNSTIRRITASEPGAKDAILVSTGQDFLPYVDEIVKALDRPGNGGKGSSIEGTGLARVAYAPKYRAASQFSEIIDTVLSSSAGKAYVNGQGIPGWRQGQGSQLAEGCTRLHRRHVLPQEPDSSRHALQQPVVPAARKREGHG